MTTYKLSLSTSAFHGRRPAWTPSHSTHALQHLNGREHKSSGPTTDLHAALPVPLPPPPRAIHRAVNLANCVNTWPHRSCVYARCYFFFTHAAVFFFFFFLNVALLPSCSLKSPLTRNVGLLKGDWADSRLAAFVYLLECCGRRQIGYEEEREEGGGGGEKRTRRETGKLAKEEKKKQREAKMLE